MSNENEEVPSLSIPKQVLADADREIADAERLIDKLACPTCRQRRSKVVDSRPARGRRQTDEGIWRRRKCIACGTVFTTREVIYGGHAA